MGNAEADTIIAPISGRGAVTLFRVSGPGCRALLEGLSASAGECLAAPRTAALMTLRDPRVGEDFDQAVVTFFASPASYTGEDSLEICLHGSVVLAQQLMAIAASCDVRPAEPGEFTKRAYLNGKLDLTQAEAVADLIAAETAEQARHARLQLEGQLTAAVSVLGEPLRDLLAEIEARIDFPEEGIAPAVQQVWIAALESGVARCREYIATYRTGRILHDGAEVAIVGAPNAGKSSLLNRLLGEQRAIVTDIPGTTRDEIAERIALDGVPVRLWDTAGIVSEGERELDPVESIGIKRSRARIQNVDLIILLVDATAGFEAAKSLLAEVQASSRPFLFVGNKHDLLAPPALVQFNEAAKAAGLTPLFVSALAGHGIPELLQGVSWALLHGERTTTGALLITSRRHVEALQDAEAALVRALELFRAGESAMELPATELQSALGALQDIVGVTTSEDILGRIFAKFCVGK